MVQMTEELLEANKKGKERTREMEACFDTWVQRCEEVDKVRELNKNLQRTT